MFRNTVFIFLLFAIGITSYAQNNNALEIRKVIKYDTDLEYGKTNGFHIALIDKDTSIVYRVGHFDTTSNLLYEVGSVTKALTSSLVTKLVDKAYFKLSDPINKYLPSNFSNPRMDHIRILDLLEHTSGLPKRPNDFGIKELHIQNPYASYSKLDLLRFYRDFLPDLEIGSYHFSHTNYGLLEVIIEGATQENFDFLMNKHIFSTLGMNDSYVDFSEYVEDNIAQGFDRSGEEVNPWKFRSFCASNGVKTNIYDLSKFLLANINTSSFDPNHEKQHLTNLNKNIYGARGWLVIEGEANYDIITTSGKTSGHHATIAFIKETKTGVVVMSNNAFGSKNLALLLLRMINDNWDREQEGKL